VERCVYALLEKAYKQQQKGEPPTLPVWLSPTQVRIIPMSDKYLEHCERIAETLETQQIRVDIDDRPLTLQKRVREAEMEWIPYIIVIGEKEIELDVLPVRDRKAKKIRKMKLEEFISEVKKQVQDKPFKPPPLPRQVSKRPQFYG
jgi:threonyl-tRNA synthetase